MQINTSNYEIWFIDWLDGNLNNIQVEKLIQFLKENPDLKNEFDELSSVRLKPAEKTLPNKNHLKKSTENISDSQFEFMCIAYTENDLSAEQCSELKEIVERDIDKKRIFELFQKTKFTATPVSYKGKNLLIRRTISQNVLRFAIIGLSAAAVTIFAIILFNLKPNIVLNKYQKTAQNVQSSVGNGRDRSLQLDYSAIASQKIISAASARIAIQRLVHTGQSAGTTIPIPGKLRSEQASLPTPPARPSIIVAKITFSSEVFLEGNEISRSLIALNPNVAIPSDYDDGQSRFSKFIAKAFREKLLREKTPKDNPLKAYEIAEASITGLNKLLGWEMALDERKDENGRLKSVYFSSKLLKFNAPVNKDEPVK